MDIFSLALVGVLLVVIVILVALYILTYNRLFRFRNAAEATLGQIRVAMKKRLDMIEQLLGAVQSYAKFERGVLERVTELRATVMQAGAGSLSDIQRESQSLIGSIRAVAEAYPDLKTSTTVTKLMEAIVSVEEEIARQRYTYNNVVQEFNTMTDTIPSNIVSGTLGLKKLEYLQFEDKIEEAPKVKGIAPD